MGGLLHNSHCYIINPGCLAQVNSILIFHKIYSLSKPFAFVGMWHHGVENELKGFSRRRSNSLSPVLYESIP